LLVSAGFDAHRADPLTDMGLTSADYADLVVELVGLVPTGRVVLFLEGGYDLGALADSAGATVAAIVGMDYRPEQVTGRGRGGVVGEVDALVVDLVRRHGLEG
jgi:acetoin utilization deacetylase AcuC-like enzyme